MDDLITDEMKQDAEGCPTLGPAYFAARKVVAEVCEGLDEEPFKELFSTFADKLNEQLQSRLEDHLFTDTEDSLYQKVWHMVDQIVRGLLSGEKWVMDRYALGTKYDCEAIRAELVKHIPKEVQDKRIVELEEQVDRLKKDLQFERGLRY